jgi:hypothetical protein
MRPTLDTRTGMQRHRAVGNGTLKHARVYVLCCVCVGLDVYDCVLVGDGADVHTTSSIKRSSSAFCSTASDSLCINCVNEVNGDGRRRRRKSDEGNTRWRERGRCSHQVQKSPTTTTHMDPQINCTNDMIEAEEEEEEEEENSVE